jgi:hypothetical protein
MKHQITVRALVVCAASLAVAWILTEVVWGATCGLVGGLATKSNPEYQRKLLTFLQDKGVDTRASASEARAAYAKLTPEDQEELKAMTRDAMQNVNWFFVTLFVSIVVFGGVGFVHGMIARSWVLAPLIHGLSFLLNNPVVRFSMARELTPLQKTIVVVAQFVVCSGLALLGAKIIGKRKSSGRSVASASRAGHSVVEP